MRDVIIYIGSIFLPDKSAGAQRALSLSKSFRDLGYKVCIVGMSDDKNIEKDIIKTKAQCMGFDSFCIPQPRGIADWIHHTVSVKEFKRVVDYYKSERVFAIVTMEYEAIPLLRLSSYCKKKGIHLIADAEEWYEKSNQLFPMNIAKDFDTNLRMKYVYPKKIKNMICISRFFENHYKNMVENRVYVPGTVDPQEEKWLQLDAYKPNDVFTIGYAGHPGVRFEKERLDLLIRAVSQLNEAGHRCRLKIAGLDKDFIAVRLPDIKLDDNGIKFLGKISHRECLNMIATADFSAIIREDKRVTEAGFPTKFSESLGCGTPIIVTKSSNICEYITSEAVGVCCDGYTVSEVKQGIIKAMKIPAHQLMEIHRNLKENNPLQYKRFNEDIRFFLNSAR